MAYVEEQDPKKQLVPGAPTTTNQGSTLAGSGGTAPSGPANNQAASTPGSGFTNLENYLGANKGQGAKVADEINAAGDSAIKEVKDTASGLATTYEADGTAAANAGAAQGIADAKSGFSGSTAYNGPAEAPKDNDLEKAYQNVNDGVDAFSNDPYKGQSALQKNHGYGQGFAALDNFIGRQDGRENIQQWEKNSKAGNAQSSYDKGNAAIKSAKDNLKTEQDKWWESQRKQRNEHPWVPPPPPGGGNTGLPPPTDDIWTQTEKGPTVFDDADPGTPPATPPPTNTGGGQVAIDPDLMNAPAPTTTPVGPTIPVAAPPGTAPATPPPQSGGGQLALDPNLMFPTEPTTPTPPKAIGIGGEDGIDTGETEEQRIQRIAEYQAEKAAAIKAQKQKDYERDALALVEKNNAYLAAKPELYITQKIDELQNSLIRMGFSPMTPQQIEEFRVSEGYPAKAP
jgi:hypothetical protein